MRILSLTIGNHKVISNEEIQIFDFENNKISDIAITMLIGANGTAKSTLLEIISTILQFSYKMISDELSMSKKPKYSFSLYYMLNENEYRINYTKNYFITYKNEENYPIQIEDLPQNIIAIANTIYDKFDVNHQDQIDSEFYSYLGIKSNNNSAITTTHLYRTLDLIFESSFKEKRTQLIEVFRNLNFKPSILFRFKFKNIIEIRNGKNNNYSIERFLSEPNKIKSINKNYWRKLSENSKRQIVDYLKKYARLNLFGERFIERKDFEIQLNLDSLKPSEELINEYQSLSHLRKLALIKYKDILIQKGDKKRFDIRQASSGEVSFLTTFISLIAKIKKNSLILIDEPEISLHPKWQIIFLDTIYKLFNDYKTSHFIIATHSHFLVSDLKNNATSIVHTYNQNDFEIKFDYLNVEPYGKSAEEVLYNIFNVATQRNHYFEMDLRKLLFLLKEKPEDKVPIKELVEKFEKFSINENDPLVEILRRAKEVL